MAGYNRAAKHFCIFVSVSFGLAVVHERKLLGVRPEALLDVPQRAAPQCTRHLISGVLGFAVVFLVA